MVELTEAQRKELVTANAPRLVDPETLQRYVLVREELYEQMKDLFDAKFQPQEAYPAIDKAFAEGWSDPSMDDYDRYEELRG